MNNYPERGPKGRFQKKNAAENRERSTEIAKSAKEAKRRRIDRGLERPKFSCGVRVCDIQHLGKEMWCSRCNIPLSFRDAINEAHHGLASVYKINCHQCQRIINISTSKKAVVDGCDSGHYEINLKAALGNYCCLVYY